MCSLNREYIGLPQKWEEKELSSLSLTSSLCAYIRPICWEGKVRGIIYIYVLAEKCQPPSWNAHASSATHDVYRD